MANPYPLITNPRGFLRPFKEHKGIYVDFSYQTDYLTFEQRREIIDYFSTQGYAEAHPLPYEIQPNALIVVKDVLGYYYIACDREDSPIPYGLCRPL